VTSSSLTGQRLEQRTDCRPELLLDLNADELGAMRISCLRIPHGICQERS